jgi:hypothetical protein
MQQSNPIQVALNWVSVAPLSSDPSMTSCNDDDGGCTSSDDDDGGRTARSLTAPALQGTKEQELQAQASS